MAYHLNGTTYTAQRGHLSRVEIGDSKQPDFKPQIKIPRWDNTVNASFRLVHDDPAEVFDDGETITYRTASLEAQWYGLEDVEPDDGHEFAVRLLARPQSPVLTFTMQTKGITFVYQAPLAYLDTDGSTWEPNPWGGTRRRPAHVNGSYAGYTDYSGDYSALGGHNYRSGKALHIYRPWAEDARGVRVWCALQITDNRLTITIPQDFLDTAVYPVLVDPTFGYSGTAASDDNVGTAHILYKAVTTPASSGTLDSITIRGRIKAGAPTHEPAIYSDLVGAPVNRLAAVNSGGTAFTGSDSDITTNISYGSIASGTQYWLGSRCNGSTSSTLDYWFKFDTAGGTANFYYLIDSNPATTDWEATTVGWSSLDNERVYIYASYTASGASPFAGLTDPNPARRRTPYESLTGTSNDLTSRLPVVAPFYVTNWPNPRGKAYPQSLREFSSYYVIDDSVPFAQTQWENPRGKRYPSALREWAQSLVTTTLAPVGTPPFFLTDWPNPQRPRIDQRGFTDPSEFWMLRDSQFAGEGQFKAYDWPNPRPLDRGRDARTFTLNLLESTLAPIPGVPFTPIDWPNPLTLARGRDARTFAVNLQETTLAPFVAVPFYLTDWPNPLIKAPSYLRTFIGNPLTLNQVGGAKPFFFKDWVNPRGYAYPLSLRAWLGQIALTINQTGGLVLPESTIVLVASSHLRGLVSSTHQRDVTGPTHPRTLET